jgi:L,D-transpeptidase YcbB
MLTIGLLGGALVAGGCGDRSAAPPPDDVMRTVLHALAEDSVVTLVTGDTLRVSGSTLDFYADREWQPAWTAGGGLHDAGRALFDAIGRADEDGLRPDRYGHDVAVSMLDALDARGDARPADSLVARYRAEIDLLLTEGFNRFTAELVNGTLDPAEGGLDWRIAGEVAPGNVVLHNVAYGMAPADAVASLRPAIPYYERMRTALAQYRAAAERGGWPQLPDGATLKAGDRDTAVALLRRRLVNGTDAREAALAQVGAEDPTHFDDSLAEAVALFQERHGIAGDGAVGAATRKELDHTVEERIAEMKLNLDRWRWLPRDLGDRFLLVNIAGFELEVIDGGRTIESMNVVVGQRGLQTPVFADSLRYVVVNPYWNVPDGIMARTIRPALERDPYYLVKNDMEMVNGRVRQRPGPRNALGQYKFMFPNEYDVYLHDTPEGHLFSRHERTFSSGCVRVERPADLARLLLRLQSDQDPSSLDAMLATGRERWVRLDRPLPIYLLYFTAWVQEDGTVRFHHDVYGRDAALGEQVEERLHDLSDRRIAIGSTL